MVLQELDRLKEGASKTAKSARAAVTFLNDSFKRRHPRVRGQTGREACRARSVHVDQLCPDDSILESCLQLKEQQFETVSCDAHFFMKTNALLPGKQSHFSLFVSQVCQ